MASPQVSAKNIAIALIRETRAAGWLRAKFEIKADGTVTLDAGMVNPETDDEFLGVDLRLGK